MRVSLLLILIFPQLCCGGAATKTIQYKSADSELLKTMRRISPLPPQKPPLWVYKDTELSKTHIKSVFVSNLGKSEKDSVDGAVKKAGSDFFSVINKLVLFQFQNLAERYNLPNIIFNPVSANDKFSKSFSKVFQNNFNKEKFYTEKWQNDSGDVFFISYMLASVRTDVINQILSSTVDYEILKLKDSFQKNPDKINAKQLNRIISELEDLKKSGVSR